MFKVCVLFFECWQNTKSAIFEGFSRVAFSGKIPRPGRIKNVLPFPNRRYINSYTVTVNGYCCSGPDPIPGRDHGTGSQALPGWTEHLQCLLHSQVLNLLQVLLTEVYNTYKRRLRIQKFRYIR
jgi:hypothetical protein